MGSTIPVSFTISPVEADAIVTVDPSTAVLSNVFSPGVMLDFEWRYWNATRQQIVQDAGFKLIRIFDWRSQDGASPDPCISWNDTTRTGVFDWSSLDALVTNIFAIGAEPLVTLGGYEMSSQYLPNGMATNPSTGLPYPDSWAAYCRAWVEHFESVGLPVKYYELDNESNNYWASSSGYDAQKLGYFFDLINTAYNEMHAANSDILVGNDCGTWRALTDYWLSHGGDLDFVSFHKYDCDGPSMSDETALGRAETRFFVTNSYLYSISDVRQKWLIGRNKYMPVINSESNFAAVFAEGTDPRIQQTIGAVWNALVLRMCILQDIEYMIYYSFSSSKSWELANKPGGGFGFGIINSDDNKPWYPYFVQQFIGNNLSVGDPIVSSESSSEDVRSLAWTNQNGTFILIISKVDEPRNIFVNFNGSGLCKKIDDTIAYENPQVQIETSIFPTTLSLSGYGVILLQFEQT